MSLTSQVPRTRLQKAVLEEYIFQSAIASTFTPIKDTNGTRYEHLEDLLQHLVGNQQTHQFWRDWRESAILGVSHDLFNCIFKLSYLRRKVPLQGDNLIEAIRICSQLQAWRPLSVTTLIGLDDVTHSVPPWEMIIMSRLYHTATMIYVNKILDPTLSTSQPVVREMVGRGQRILQDVPDHKWQQASVLIWPLLILGISAISPEERECFYRPLEYLLLATNLGCVKPVLSLLGYSWNLYPKGPTGECLGLDILFRDDLLSGVMF